MPFKKGKSKKAREENIEEAMHSAKQTGKFGNQKGPFKKLQKSILGAAYGQQEKPSKKK